nr:hypothetical protein [Tanacetum cinerariifolium]
MVVQMVLEKEGLERVPNWVLQESYIKVWVLNQVVQKPLPQLIKIDMDGFNDFSGTSVVNTRHIGEDAIISPMDREYSTEKFMSKIGELRAISGHVLGASRVQIPQDDLDNLQSIREEEDRATEVSDPRYVPGSILLAVIDFTTLEQAKMAEKGSVSKTGATRSYPGSFPQ